MAYVSQETKNDRAPEIKAVLKKYGMKGSISVRHQMTLVVTLSAGKLDIIGNWYDTNTKRNNRAYPVEEKPSHLDVSRHWLDSNFNGDTLDFMRQLFDAMEGPDWYDRSDIMTDYFDTAFYVDVRVGKWDKPYNLEG